MSRDRLFSVLSGAILFTLILTVIYACSYLFVHYLSVTISRRTQITEGILYLLVGPTVFWVVWSRLLHGNLGTQPKITSMKWTRGDVLEIILTLAESQKPLTVAQLASKTGEEPSLVVDALNIVHGDGNLLSTRGYWNYQTAQTDGQGYSLRSGSKVFYRNTYILGAKSGQ
jgi:hypothetical protein